MRRAALSDSRLVAEDCPHTLVRMSGDFDRLDHRDEEKKFINEKFEMQPGGSSHGSPEHGQDDMMDGKVLTEYGESHFVH